MRGEVLSSEAGAEIARAIDAVRTGEAATQLDVSERQQAQLHPLLTQNQMLGVLVVAHETRDEDAKRQLSLRLGVLADFVALALRHARLMEEHARHQRNLEAIVEERTREVAEARAALSRQQRIAAMGKLAASIAHEVNNPMSFLVSNLSRADEYAREIAREIPALASALDSARHLPNLEDERIARARRLAGEATSGSRLMLIAEEFGAVIAEAREGVDRIQRVGDDLRRFAQGVAGVAEPVDLNRLIETALHIARAEKKPDVSFECRFGAIPEVPCQRYQITQVLLNLLQNAVEAVSAGGAVRVESRVVDACVEVEVSDDGPGLAEDELARIFEPFFTTKVDGSGLGLSISREIAVAHRGTLQASAGPEGATFRLRLPIRGVSAAPEQS
jgi:signal transduction histidine kinase